MSSESIQNTFGANTSPLPELYLSNPSSENSFSFAPQSSFSRQYSPHTEENTSFRTNLNSVSQSVIDKMVDIGGWWKEFKGNTSPLSLTGELAGAPEAIQVGYNNRVAQVIAAADDIPLSEGMARVPSTLQQTGFLRRSLGVAGGLIDGATGSLDVLEALHDENGKPGKKTMKTISKSVLQIAGGTLTASAVGAALAAGGVTVAGAPLILGGAAMVGTGYLIGRGFNYLFG